jgi:hypothetical protein
MLMSHPRFDRSRVIMKPLSERKNRVRIEQDHVRPGQTPSKLSRLATETINEAVGRILSARENNKPVMIAFGAHTIKNGLGPLLIQLMEKGWLTHLATNGAGIIHDWEFAFLGESSEEVQSNVERGEFGNWQETGFYINLALNIGAYRGLGYGESVGVMIENEALDIPGPDTLKQVVKDQLGSNPGQSAAAADLLGVIRRFNLEPGRMEIPHPYRQYSVQAAACRLKIPFTGHPMFGQDIIYNHDMNHGALLGRAAERDFLAFADGVTRLDGGVYMSIGSAVMSPMIFEKSLSMAQNLSIQQGQHIDNHYMLVVDLAESDWDWRKGEPPEDHPAYYLRYNKSFSRMGGEMRYLTADNRDFLLALYRMFETL